MNIGVLLLVKFLKKNNIIQEFIAEYKNWHNKEILDVRQLINEWEKCYKNDSSFFYGLLSSGFANRSFSFIWNSSKHGYGYWNSLNSKFISYYYKEMTLFIIPSKIKWQSQFDFIFNEIKQLDLLEDFFENLGSQLDIKITNEKQAKENILKYLYGSKVNERDFILRLILNGFHSLLWTNHNYQEEFWLHLDKALEDKLYTLFLENDNIKI